MSDLTGSSIGRYEVIQHLDQGGMAEVYKAYDTRLDRTVAIKIIRRTAFGTEVLERLVRRFEREARALARLDHPNIVKVHDFGEFDGMPFLVMDYIAGGTLKDMPKPLAPARAARLLLPIARALGYAHRLGILHRDIKPSNILLTANGEPMLADFGIAKLIEETESGHTLTGTGVGIGTPEYMAPEQGLGQEVDYRADVYSLGIVFFEMVTGRKPYSADTPMAVVLKHVTDPLPRASSLIHGLPKEVDRIIQKALAKKPENRYQDMAAFAAALEKIAGEKKETAVKASPRPATGTETLPTQDTLPPDKPGRTITPAGVTKRPALLRTTPSAAIPAEPVKVPRADSQREGWKASLRWLVPVIALAVVAGVVFLLFSQLGGPSRQKDQPAALAAAQTVLPSPTVISSTDTPAVPSTASPGSTRALPPTETRAPTAAASPSSQPSPSPTVSAEGWGYFSGITVRGSMSPITKDNLASLQEVARLDLQPWTSAWFSPNDQYFFAWDNNHIYQYDSATLQWMKTFAFDQTVLNVSPDGNLAALEMGNHDVKFVDVQSGTERYTVNSYQKTDGLYFTPDGAMFCFRVNCYTTADGKPAFNIETWPRFSPDGSLGIYFTGDREGGLSSTIYVKQFASRKLLRTWSFNSIIRGAAASQDNAVMAISTADMAFVTGSASNAGAAPVYIMSMDNGSTLHTLDLVDEVIVSLRFLSNDTILAGVETVSGSLFFWDSTSYEKLYTLAPAASGAGPARFGSILGVSANGKYLLTFTNDWRLQVWGVPGL